LTAPKEFVLEGGKDKASCSGTGNQAFPNQLVKTCRSIAELPVLIVGFLQIP